MTLIATKKNFIKDIIELDSGAKEAELEKLDKGSLQKVLDDLMNKAADAPAVSAQDETASGGDSEAADAPFEPKSGRIIGNARKNGPCRFSGITLAAKGEKTIDPKTGEEVGDSIELTELQVKDQNLMSKLMRNIGSGLLEWRE